MNSKAKKVTQIKRNTLVATVDVGKKENYGYFRTQGGRDVKPFRFGNTRQGFHRFWSRLVDFRKATGMEDVLFGFESTGPYGEPLCHFMRGQGVKVVQINPMHTKRVKDLTGNSPNKTDRKDPRVIADVMFLGHWLTVVVPEGNVADLRRLFHARERGLAKVVVVKNQLQDLLFLIFPEFSHIIKDPTTKTGRHLLKHYGLPQAIVLLGREALAEIIKRVSRGRLGAIQAAGLYDSAKRSVGITEGRAGLGREMGHLLEILEAELGYIKELETLIDEKLKRIPSARYLLSIKGVGRITAAGVIGEIGDFNNFSSSEELLKFAGLNLFEVSSGNHKGQHHISKRGRPLMRKALYFAALNVVRNGGILEDKYHQLLSRGKPKISALVAISRRLLRIMFALVRDETEYMEGYQSQGEIHRAA